MKQATLLLALILCILWPATAQETTEYAMVEGMVVDKATQEPLPFTNVWVAGSRLPKDIGIGTATDFDGNFALPVPLTEAPEAEIVISYLGYVNDTILFHPALDAGFVKVELEEGEIEIIGCPFYGEPSTIQLMLESPYSTIILTREDIERWGW